MSSREYSDLTLILPTLNEEANIQDLLEVVNRFEGIHVLVADDGSTDKTQEIVKEWHEKNPRFVLLDRSQESVHGLSASVVDGILQTRTPYFLVMDADFQHPPEKIQNAYELLVTNKFDLVVGVRERVEKWPFVRKLISWGATTIGKVSLRVRRKPVPKDIMSGFFGGKTESVKTVLQRNPKKIVAQGYKILFDIVKQAPSNWEITEFYYVFQNRERGESKMGVKHFLAFIKSALS